MHTFYKFSIKLFYIYKTNFAWIFLYIYSLNLQKRYHQFVSNFCEVHHVVFLNPNSSVVKTLIPERSGCIPGWNEFVSICKPFDSHSIPLGNCKALTKLSLISNLIFGMSKKKCNILLLYGIKNLAFIKFFTVKIAGYVCDFLSFSSKKQRQN